MTDTIDTNDPNCNYNQCSLKYTVSNSSYTCSAIGSNPVSGAPSTYNANLEVPILTISNLDANTISQNMTLVTSWQNNGDSIKIQNNSSTDLPYARLHIASQGHGHCSNVDAIPAGSSVTMTWNKKEGGWY